MMRNPAVAGSFYPADPSVLQDMLNKFLTGDAEPAPPKAIIVPHAGYIYSGPIAASAYVRLRKARDRIRRVVLLGPSHRVAFGGLALSHADSFATPLGAVPVDRVAVEKMSELSFVSYLEQAHSAEHSLEVHLPFLQASLSDFALIPLIAGDATPEQVAQALALLWGGSETLIVISSDLSHYLDYNSAQAKDRRTSQLIESLNYRRLTPDAACGCVPVSGLLRLLEQKSLSIKAIDVRNSGDTAGDKHRVVGYGAYVVE
ncbi:MULTISPECIES: AmmeMemoRadiSam system protein B [Methylomonas]|uniref:AmmeMemoRadiSam system protein B n=1 Tax=Methylomonas TaxID=416 RepID=UPI0012322FAF|nr:AmmeMemoRadiSam system protein B [Methylomonas rhizoryzae]